MRVQKLSMVLATVLSGCLGATAQGDTRQPLAQITTSDGQIYRNVTVLRADPDGLLVNYQPEPAGIGLAKLKFRNLPDSLRSQYGYDAAKAEGFETQQAQATGQWRAQTTGDTWLQRYRDLAELHRSLAGDFEASYSISLEPDGKVSAQGFTGNVLPYATPLFGLDPTGTSMTPAYPVDNKKSGPNR